MSERLPGLPPPPPPGEPRLAASVILYRRAEEGVEVYWLLRAPGLRFAGGFHAFPGGKVDAADAEVHVEGASGEQAAVRVAAVRELFEEVGVLVARGAERMSAEARNEARKALLDGTVSFGALMALHGLTLHAEDLEEAGRWVTPPSLPVRFDARFFLVALPRGEVAEPWGGELAEAEWVRPAEALSAWAHGTLLHPPQLHVFRVLANIADLPTAAAALRVGPNTKDGVPDDVEFQKGIRVVPLLTATLPPAAHTNCYLVGNGELLVVDPGTADEAELRRLYFAIGRLEGEGYWVKAVVLTHHHGDHASGAARVAAELEVPLWCHARTAERIPVKADRLLEDGEVLELAGEPPMRLRVLHTPGHAPGHICLVDEASRGAVVGDMVAGVGTILIDPSEGDMAEYLRQLARLREYPVRALHPAHGPALPNAALALERYIQHRLMREAKVLAAVPEGGGTLEAITAVAYDDTPPFLHTLAERSALAHLVKLERDGKVVRKTSHSLTLWERDTMQVPSPSGRAPG
ncbi:MAG: MBL fold metallo-hydrolase [Myxococcaceae bacterium]|nr:MBL fold metallo-hydrolase [Myxococcaceae bacterium]